MSRRQVLPAFAIISAALALAAHGEDARQENLSPAYLATVREALRSFAQRDFDSAIALIDKAEKMYPPTAVTVNTRAAVAIERKEFAEGRELCLRALQMQPTFFPARFNLAEIPFMQGKFAEARLAYEKLIEEQPREDLAKFRLYLTYLLEKNNERAAEELEKIPLINDSPIYFAAHAAWEFAHGNTSAAHSFLKSAETVFPPSKNGNFVNVFYDIGWLEREKVPTFE